MLRPGNIDLTMRFSFQAEQWVPYDLPRVFAFFADPGNLPRLMPAWQQARIDEAVIVPPPSIESESTASIVAGAGTRLTLSFRPFPYSPIRLAWEAEIGEFAWNDHFCDRQLRGPFAYWNHCHRVHAASRNDMSGTIVTDRVEYEVPFGIFGELAHRLVLRGQIEGAFRFRQKRLVELLAVQPIS